MGQSNSSLKQIQQLTRSAITLRHSAGERTFFSTKNRGEYILITRLLTDKEAQFERIIDKRKEIRGQFVAELVQCGKEQTNYCTNVEYLHLLFKRPAKTLLEEVNNRRALDEWFEEGQVMMIGYCVLQGLKLLREMSYEYDITVNQSSLFISNDGAIVLSDTEQYTDRLSSKQCHSHRLKENKYKNKEQFSLSQLGLVLDHLEKGAKARYSEGLRGFIDQLIMGQINSFNLALQNLYMLKKSSKNTQQRDAMLSLISLCTKSNKMVDLKLETKTSIPHQKSNSLAKKHRVPLGQFNGLENIQKQDQRSIKRVKSNLQVHGSKKQNGYLAYKSQFQAGVMQSLAEQNRVFQEGVTVRLDQLSSIVERGASKQLEQEQEHSTFLLQQLQKPEKNTTLAQPNSGGMPFLQIPMIDLFSPSRPQRLKQLVLNQKGIIYEQSGDELESLASQRTFRHKVNLQ